MTDRKSIALDLAMRLHEQLICPQTPTQEVVLPQTSWDECTRLARQIGKAEVRGWHLAARRLRDSLWTAIHVFRSRIDEFPPRLESLSSPQVVPKPREIYEDLLALDGEFNDVEIDRTQVRISVTTDPIQLEGIDLGAFSIVLDGRSIGDPSPYEIVAVDPRPAASSCETTHPHVEGNLLCEGEARMAIRSALKQGRFLDFFLIVRQTLQTYNRASAYVRLDEWTGIECRDCGARVDDDERCRCQDCDADFCSECVYSCSGCGDDFCVACQRTCPECEDACCRGCVAACADCNRDFCEECLTDGKCPDCRSCDEEKDQDVEQSPSGEVPRPATTADAKVQPHGVGEAIVSA